LFVEAARLFSEKRSVTCRYDFNRPRMINIALSSRDPQLQPLLAPALGRDFHITANAGNERLKELLSNGSVDVLLLDLDTNYCGLEEQVALYNQIKESGIGVVVMTGDDERSAAIGLVQHGAHTYCRKPPVVRELRGLIRRAYEHTTLKREPLNSREHQPAGIPSDDVPGCDSLIGVSAAMRSTYELIHRVADLNASVLITGDSGTGKELIARAIHNLGHRAGLPFVAVSCGAIPETLIESELFGHEKGAFTGTVGTRTGYFEQAGSGTLFLDEIGELSLQTQVKLLRVLQQREFTRLGSGRSIPLKARILFATHRDLSRMVADHTFRLDLYYRINVMTIRAPALADHPEDIPLLAEHFLRQYSELYNKRMSSIALNTLAMLADYDWPGNVRELENVIQGALICADGPTILPRDLPERFREQQPVHDSDVTQVGTFERLLRDYKVKLATKAIEDCNGNKTLAARNLNISRAYLHRLIRLAEEPETVDAA
jgi:DNA-binding NtrC family response regulator